MNQSSLDNISLQTLAQQSSNHLCWTIFSSLGIITNLIVLITIACTKSLHNRSQFVVFSHAVSEFLLVSSYFGTGLARYLAYAFHRPQTSDVWSCAWKQMPLLITGPLMQTFATALAADRFICIAFPFFYRGLNGKKYIFWLNIIVWTYGLGHAFAGFLFLQSKPLIPVCTAALIFDQKFMQFGSFSSNAIVCVAALMYFGLACILFYRYKRAKFVGEAQRIEWKRNMDFEVLVAVLVIGMMYLACSGASTIFSSIAAVSTIETVMVLTPFVSTGSFVSSVSHLFVYLKLNGKFRKGARRLFDRAAQSVHPAA